MFAYLYSFFFEPTKTINDTAFTYCRKSMNDKINSHVEIETDSFSNTEDIKTQLLALPDANKLLANRIDTDIIPAIKYYLNDESKLYTNKTILAQTDFFVFMFNHTNVSALIIKNRNI